MGSLPEDDDGCELADAADVDGCELADAADVDGCELADAGFFITVLVFFGGGESSSLTAMVAKESSSLTDKGYRIVSESFVAFAAMLPKGCRSLSSQWFNFEPKQLHKRRMMFQTCDLYAT